MSFLLKPRIFQYFGINAKVKDTFKDVDGKGIWERYNEVIGESYDDELSDLIDNFTERTLVAKTMLATMIPYLESMLGDPIIVSHNTNFRRKILQFAQHIYNIKSTALSYEVLYKMLGFETVTIQEYVIMTGFDCDIGFDDPVRTFDSDEKPCVEYAIRLTGSISITQGIYDAVFRIAEFLEPINADLREITYNGEEIVPPDGIFDFSFDETFE